MTISLVRAGDVREGDVVELARGPRKVTGVPFQSETRIELAYEDARYGSFNVETELQVRKGRRS